MSNNPLERGVTGKPPPPPPRAQKNPAPARDLASAADVLNPEALIGMMVGPFRLVEIIGYGGFGVVYLAEHAELGSRFALKLVRAHQKHDSDLLKRFQREANLLASLHHPNIVRLKDFGQIGDHGLYFAMEYLQGRDLKETLIDDYPLSQDRVRRIIGQLCDALKYMHSKQIYHRDLKPANVILVPQGGGRELLKLIDFGIASTVSEDDTNLTQTGVLMGSMPYISPEQARGESARIDGRSDLYSLGIMLYQLLTQQLPYQSNHIPGLITHHLFTPPPSLSKYRPEQPWSPALDAFIAKALAKSPDDRFPTAGIFWSELLQALSEQPDFDRAALSTIEPLVDDSVEAIMLTPHDEVKDGVIDLPEDPGSVEVVMQLAAAHDVQDELSFSWSEDPHDVEVTSLLQPDLIVDPEATKLFARDDIKDDTSGDLGLSVTPTISDLDDSVNLSAAISSPMSPFAQAPDEGFLEGTRPNFVRSELIAEGEESAVGSKGLQYSAREVAIFVVFLLVGGLVAYFLLFHKSTPTPKKRIAKQSLGPLPSLRKGSQAAQTKQPNATERWSWRLETLPAGATIFQGSKAIGLTPHTFYGSPNQIIAITIVRQGFQSKALRWRLQQKKDRILLPLTPLVTDARPAPRRASPPPASRARRGKPRRSRPKSRARRRWMPPPPPPPPGRSQTRPRPRPRKRIYDVADPF